MQVSLMGVSIYGIEDMPIYYDKLQQRRNSELEQNSVVARQQDLAFVMYTDKDIAEVFYNFTIYLLYFIKKKNNDNLY